MEHQNTSDEVIRPGPDIPVRQETMDDGAIGRLIHGLAKILAIAGGLVLIAVVVTVVCSVIGRTFIWAGLRPIAGDYEIVEAGVFFAIFAFMPWCHLMRGHAIVAVVTDHLSARVNVVIELFMDVLMLAVALFIAWRHWAGMMDKFSYQETTFILRMPIWWSYAAGMIGAAAFVIVAVYVVARSTVAAASPNPQMPSSGMVE